MPMTENTDSEMMNNNQELGKHWYADTLLTTPEWH